MPSGRDTKLGYTISQELAMAEKTMRTLHFSSNRIKVSASYQLLTNKGTT
jgi:hypothetical protein